MDQPLPWHRPTHPTDEEPETVVSTAQSQFGDQQAAPVVVAVIHGPVLAEMACEALQTAGIPAMTRRNTTGAIYGMGLGSWGDVPLLVPAVCVEAALAVLDEMGLIDDRQ